MPDDKSTPSSGFSQSGFGKWEEGIKIRQQAEAKLAAQERNAAAEADRMLSERNAKEQDFIGYRQKSLNIANQITSVAREQLEQGDLTFEQFKSIDARLESITSETVTQKDLNKQILDIELEIADAIRSGNTELVKTLKNTKAIAENRGEELENAAQSKEMIAGMDGLTGGMISKANAFGKALKTPVGATFAIIGLIVGLMSALGAHTDKIGKEFGAIGVNEFQTDLMGATAEAQKLGLGFADVSTSVNQLSDNFGVSFDKAIDMSEATMDTSVALGISVDNAAKLTGMLMTMSGHSADTAQDFLKQTAALAKSAGVAPKAVMNDMANSSEDIAKFTKGSGENIAQAAVKARQMGMELGDVAKIADGLLNFGASLEAEMNASVMLGKQLNLQKARELALAGDLEGMTAEVLKNVGSEAEFNKMNVLQRKALADAVGVSVDQMSKMVKETGKTKDELASMRELDISEIVSEDAIAEITKMKNLLKSISTQILAVIAHFANMGGGVGLLVPIIGALGVAAAFFWIKGKLMAITLKSIGKAAPQGGAGLAAFAASGSAAIPLLLAIALIGATLVGVFFGIGYIVKQVAAVFKELPPVIDAVAAGFKVIATAATNSIIKLASPAVVLGMMGLAGAFFMLAGALTSFAFAGQIAMPAMIAVGVFTAAMTALSVIGGGGEEKETKFKETEEGKLLNNINEKLGFLVDGFGGNNPVNGAYIESFADKVPKSTIFEKGLFDD